MTAPIDSYGRAAAAYARAARAEPASEAQSPARQSFADLLRGTLDEAVSAGRVSEKASVAAVQQGGDLNHVVTAVAEAELTLQTVVAVRERIIEAYKDILRMPI
jgi:flagellar hook-basal body complex protein FliE